MYIYVYCTKLQDRVIRCITEWKKSEFDFQYIDKNGIKLRFSSKSNDGPLCCKEMKKAMKEDGVSKLLIYNISEF